MKRERAGLAILAMSLLLATSTLKPNIQLVKANPGYAVIKVQYLDRYPRSNAEVVITFPSIITCPNTDEDGLTTCTGLSPYTVYQVNAYYPSYPTDQFGPINVAFETDENGDAMQNPVMIMANKHSIDIDSPQNTTYTSRSVPLGFTFHNSSVISWMGYSLDGQSNGTIAGNTILTGLADGLHHVLVHGNDTNGYTGYSPTVYFTISTHDIAVTSGVPSKTVGGQGYTVNITVAVENQGSYTEAFNASVFYNDTIIILPDGKNHTATTLPSGNSTTLVFTWNTTGVVIGNYTISANATILPDEADTADNTFMDGTVLITFPGDVNGDGKVRIDDILAVALAFGSDLGDPKYEPNLDINGDDKIRVDDILIAALNFGLG